METSQPLLVNTAPLLEVHPNTENLEREETVQVQRFLTDGCGCDLTSGSCSSTFTAESVESYMSHCSELTRAELDMAILGQLSAFTNTSTHTVHSSKHRHSPSSRQRAYMLFWHGGRRVCKKMFLFLHTISEKRLRNLQANTISFADTQRVVEFLQTYAEANTILLPGRIPGYKRSDVQLLPSSTTNATCGSSTAHRYSLSLQLTIRPRTPPSAPSGGEWCHRSSSPSQ